MDTNLITHALGTSLTKASECAEYLRAALSVADPVAALVLLPLIGDAHRLAQSIEALIQAKKGE